MAEFSVASQGYVGKVGTDWEGDLVTASCSDIPVEPPVPKGRPPLSCH